MIIFLLTDSFDFNQFFVREDEDDETDSKGDQVGCKGISESFIGKKPRPGKVSKSKGYCSKEDELIQFGGDSVGARYGSLAPCIE